MHCSTFPWFAVPLGPTPAAVVPAAGVRTLVQVAEEGLVADAIAHAHRIFEQALRQIEARDRRIRMPLAHELSVTAQDRRLHAACTDHVIRHEQELAVLRPAVVLCHNVGQIGHRACRHVVVQQQVEYRHEVALAGAETAMQIGCLAVPPWTDCLMKVSASLKQALSCGVTT